MKLDAYQKRLLEFFKTHVGGTFYNYHSERECTLVGVDLADYCLFVDDDDVWSFSQGVSMETLHKNYYADNGLVVYINHNKLIVDDGENGYDFDFTLKRAEKVRNQLLHLIVERPAYKEAYIVHNYIAWWGFHEEAYETERCYHIGCQSFEEEQLLTYVAILDDFLST